VKKSAYVVALLLLLSFFLALSAQADTPAVAGSSKIPLSPNSDVLSPQSRSNPFFQPPVHPFLQPSTPKSPHAPDVQIIYVDVSATGANDGSSWANAYTDLTTAISNASNPSIIWIAEGVYTPGTQREDSFVLKDGIIIQGGFPSGGGDGSLEARFPAAHETVLSGEIGAPGPDDNSYHVVTGDSTANELILLDGVSIAHGRANGGGDDNTGAGLMLDSSIIYLANCKIYDNHADDFGPAIRATNLAEVRIQNCIIEDNRNSNEGSALDFRASTLILYISTVRNNHSAFGVGPLWMVSSDSTLVNSVIVNNTNDTPSSGVITLDGGGGYISHVSMSGHNQTGLTITKPGINTPTVTVNNSIFWGNGPIEMTADAGVMLTVSDSVVAGGFAGGTNIINADPIFVDPANGDLSLGDPSPAIDTIDPGVCDPFDIRNYQRPIGAKCEMGAYEKANRNTICKFDQLDIPDSNATGIMDVIPLDGFNGLILDVDVGLNITHTSVNDLTVELLRGPDVSRMILNRPVHGESGQLCLNDNIAATLDDEGRQPADLTCGLNPPALSGNLVPTQALSAFDHQPTDSVWGLIVRDLISSDVGKLEGWCLTFDWIPTLTVTRTDDPVPNGCTFDNCSLREAILASNSTPDIDDTITFAVDGTFVLSQTGADEDLAATGDLDITDTVTIMGNGTDSTIIDGGSIDRVFDVDKGIETGLTLIDLTVQNGLAEKADFPTVGGGLQVIGEGRSIKLQRTILRDNRANSPGVFSGSGGAVYVGPGAYLEIRDSAIHDNDAESVGAIYSDNAEVEILNSTIYGNTGTSGAIFNEGNSYLSLRNATVAANPDTVAILTFVNDAAHSANLDVVNSIISAPGLHCDTSVEGAGTITINSGGNNIIGDDSCGLNESSDLPNTNPMLGPLADNGGPTPTAALLKGSPALDGGNDFGCLPNDQRGQTRYDRDGNGDGGADDNPCDAGAYEAPAAFANTPPVANPQTLTTPMNTIKNFTLNGSDADGDPLTFQIVTETTNGVLLGQFPNIAYQPNPGFIGMDSFTFRVNDGQADSPPALITINVTAVTPVFKLYLPSAMR